jgi:hypothetical protein
MMAFTAEMGQLRLSVSCSSRPVEGSPPRKEFVLMAREVTPWSRCRRG